MSFLLWPELDGGHAWPAVSVESLFWFVVGGVSLKTFFGPRARNQIRVVYGQGSHVRDLLGPLRTEVDLGNVWQWGII